MNNLDSLEMRIVLASARTQLSPEEQNALNAMAAQNPDWTAVLAMAKYHGLVPLLHKHLKSVFRLIDETVLGSLVYEARLKARQNFFYSAELLRIKSLLDKAGIEFFAFKGPALAMQAYGELALRSFSDIDIIIDGAQFGKARKLLMDSEYFLWPRREQAISDKFLDSPQFLRLSHEQSFGRCQGGKADPSYIVDLHWQPGESSAMQVDGSLLKEWSTNFPLSGQTIRTFQPLLSVILLCAHGTKHRWTQIKWLVDIAELLRVNPDLDFDKLYELAKRLHVSRKIDLLLRLLDRIYGATIKIPAPLLERVRKDSVLHNLADQTMQSWPVTEEPICNNRTQWSYQLQTFDSGADATRYLMHEIFQPTLPTYLWLPLPPTLHALYFVLQPVYLVRGFFNARVSDSQNNEHAAAVT